MREKRDFRLERKGRELTPDTLAKILRNTTVEKDASEVYKRLTGKKIPELKGKNNNYFDYPCQKCDLQTRQSCCGCPKEKAWHDMHRKN